MNERFCIVLVITFSIAFATACGQPGANNSANAITTSSPATATAAPTPAKSFTTTDVAKLKWLEGTWRGMDGDKPFYERYRLEESALVVETLKEDGSPAEEPGRFELKDGEFGKTEGNARSAASEITDTYVQFVPAVGTKGNNFRFEKQPHGWDAILEWTAADGTAKRKVYRMEPWQPKK
jgi:hypothetical protein